MGWPRIGTRVLVAGALVLSLSTVQAGESLHFNHGSFDPNQADDIRSSGVDLLSPRQTTKYFVIQFSETVSDQTQEILEKHGAQVFRYIPDDAYIISTQRSPQWLADQVGARVIIPYSPVLRRDSSLNGASVFSQHQRQRLLIRFFQESALDRFLVEAGHIASTEFASGKVVIADVEQKDIADVIAFEGVEWVQKYVPMQLQHLPLAADMQPSATNGNYKDLSGYESGTKVMGFTEAWSRGYAGQGQKVSYADTGLDSGAVNTLHADFRSNVTKGYQFGLYATDWSDPFGHGTHVGGSIAGDGTISGDRIRGGAYGAELIPQGMWSPLMNNLTVPPKLSDLFAPAYQDGARIHSNSWGNPQKAAQGRYDNMAVQVDEFAWANPEMLIVFAAGNSGIDENRDGHIDPGSVSPPATSKNSLSVGASENYVLDGGIQRTLGELAGGKPWGTEPLKSDRLSDNANGMAAFSSVGPTVDGRFKPDVVAPGSNILSNCSQIKGANELWGKYNNDYCWSGGTSMSTPLAAGAAAVVRQYLAAEQGLVSPSAALVKAILLNTAFDMYPGQYGTGSGQEFKDRAPNAQQGYGRVDVAKATLQDNYYLIDDSQVATSGQTSAINVPVRKGSVKITLVYTDAPGAPSAAKALVNDLDLEVSVNGKQYRSESRVNNSEQVSFEVQQDTNLVISVTAQRIAQGKNGGLPYALVVTN